MCDSDVTFLLASTEDKYIYWLSIQNCI